MAFLDTTLDGILDGTISVVDDIVRMSLHTDEPDGTGSNETTAGRQTFAWTDPALGDTAIDGAVNFTGGAASGACTHVGLWDATDTTFYGSFALTQDTSFDESGNFTVTTGAVAGSSTG